MTVHWTGRSVEDYRFRIAADFIAQLEKKMESPPISQDELAKKLGLTKGRVSQLINHPGNLTLSKIIKYASALGLKVSIVAYEDDDPENKKGPIDSEIFQICWEKSGKPCDFWAFQDFNGQLEISGHSTTGVTYTSAWAPGYVWASGYAGGVNITFGPNDFPITAGQKFEGNVRDTISEYYVGKTAMTPKKEIKTIEENRLELVA